MLRFSRRQGLRLMLGASQAVLLGAAGCAQEPAGYASTVTGIPGLIAYWRFSNASGVIDAVGGRHGTWEGTVSLVPGLPAASDPATLLPGTVRGTIPHDAGLLLPAFSLSLWFSVTQIDTVSVLISKDASNLVGLIDGRFFLSVRPRGELFLRFRETGEDGVDFHEIVMPEGTIEANTAYHAVVTAGPGGFELWLNGQHLETNQEFGRAWEDNNVSVNIGGAFFTSALMTGVIDEIALYSRVIDDADIIALSQVGAPPSAVAGAIVVDEGASATVGVVDGCVFVGRKGDLVIDVTPGSHGMVSVNATKDIVYTAHPGEGGEADSFQYRISDAKGTSAYATVSVTIQEVDGGPPPSEDVPAELINPYPASGLSTVVVSSMAALESAVNAAPPGRHILIAAGTYSGGTRTFNRAGTASNPIVIRPQGARGSVTIDAPTWTVAPGSSRLVFKDLFFNNAGFRIEGANNRITRCRFRQIGRRCFLPLAAVNYRIDHNDFSDWVNNTTDKNLVWFSASDVGSGASHGFLFDRNYIHDGNVTTNTRDAFYGSTASLATNASNPNAFFDHNLFRNLSFAGHGEFCVIKHPQYKVRFTTFENVKGYLQQRTGTGLELRSCWFENCPRTAILHVFDDFRGQAEFGMPPPLVIGNRFVGGHGLWIGCGDHQSAQLSNWFDFNAEGKRPHPACWNGKFVGNVFDTGTIEVGRNFSNPERTRARANEFRGNIRNGAPMTTGNGIILSFHELTVISTDTTGYSWTPADKLTPSDVGMAAPDPLHPGGPQS